jgi:glutamate-1-semialdehyde aminotransferase
MIELKLYVSDIDFEAVLKTFAGSGIPGGAAAMAVRALPEKAKEELAVKYLNSSAQKLSDMLENGAAQKGIHLKISGAKATTV